MIGLFVSPHGLVDRHFAGRSSATLDRRLFAHLPGCPRCRARYRAHSLLEELAPDPSGCARTRLAPAVFGSAAARALSRPWVFGGLGLAVAAAGWLLVARPALDGQASPAGPSAFQARGEAEAEGRLPGEPGGAPESPTLEVFRVPAGGPPVRAGAVVHRGDGLAFSYRNPPEAQDRSYLLVFARAPDGRVFWYWPAWQDPAARPTALPIQTTDIPIELGESVRHPLPVGPVELFALFAAHPYTVADVEAALAQGPAGLEQLGASIWRETLEVLP